MNASAPTSTRRAHRRRRRSRSRSAPPASPRPPAAAAHRRRPSRSTPAIHDALDAPDRHGHHRAHPLHQQPAPVRLAAEGAARRCSPAPRAACGSTTTAAAPRAAVRRRRRADRLRRQRSPVGLRRDVATPSTRADAARSRQGRHDRPARPTTARRRSPTITKALNRARPRTWTLSGAEPDARRRPARLHACASRPKDDGGLLGAAEVAWDAANGVPLRAAVYAAGQNSRCSSSTATDITYGNDRRPATRRHPAGRRQGRRPRAQPAAARATDSAARSAADGHGPRRRADAGRAFKLAAPATLAGLPRQDVRLVQRRRRTPARS